jgi:nucleotide-binding universal stress UspA family protein
MRRLHVRQVLCPIDFSSLTSGSLRIASAIARARKAELRALHVLPSEGGGAPAGLGSSEQQAVMSRLRTTLGEKADLVVIGAPRRWTSTTHAVLSRSLCPVLVTHHARPLPRPSTSRTQQGAHTVV